MGQLREGQGQELIQAGEGLHIMVAVIALHTSMKLFEGQQGHDLGEHRPTIVHGHTLTRTASGIQIVAALNDRQATEFLRIARQLRRNVGTLVRQPLFAVSLLWDAFGEVADAGSFVAFVHGDG